MREQIRPPSQRKIQSWKENLAGVQRRLAETRSDTRRKNLAQLAQSLVEKISLAERHLAQSV